MADVRADCSTDGEVRPRPGGGQYPDYEFGDPVSGSFYGRYESGRDLDYYEADPNLTFVLEGHLDGETMVWARERLGVLGERSGHVLVHKADETDRANHELVRYDRRDLRGRIGGARGHGERGGLFALPHPGPDDQIPRRRAVRRLLAGGG